MARLLTPIQGLRHVKFAFTHFGHNNLLASLPRSGFNYTRVVLNLALDLSEGGVGNYSYGDDHWFTEREMILPMDWRTPVLRRHLTSQRYILFHTFNHYGKLWWVYRRSKLNIVVLLRNAITQMESRLLHAGMDLGAGPAAAEFLNETIRFYNSWGRFLERHPNAILLRYEDLVAQPEIEITKLCTYWGFEFDSRYIGQAVRLTSREEMHQHIPADRLDTNKRVSVVQATGDRLSERTLLLIAQNLHRLKYDFGYDLQTAIDSRINSLQGNGNSIND